MKILTEDELDLIEFRLWKHTRKLSNGWKLESFWNWWATTGRVNIKVDGLGQVTVIIDSKNGGDYDNDELYTVFQIKDESGQTIYVRKNGTYNSYDEDDWSGDFFQVEPKPVTRFDYVPIT